MIGTRGGENPKRIAKSSANTQAGNFCFIFGTSPTNTVDIDTKMVKNLLDHMILKQDKIQRFIEFPAVLNQIDTEDAKFEMATSNSIQICKVYHAKSRFKNFYKNTVNPSYTIGVIVENRHIQIDENNK